MHDYTEIEAKLNEYDIPLVFHDMTAVNVKFEDDSITVRFVLAKYLDEFGILDDDKHYAILEVKYKGVKIKKLNMYGVINFRNLSILGLSNEPDDIILLNLYEDEYDCYFSVYFKYKSFKWKIIDVITEEELDNFEALFDYEQLYNLQSVELPEWAKL